MLRTDALTFTKGNKDLISNISLTFAPGKLYGIFGPNGSGKTTFMKTVSGIWKPTSGKVYWQDQDLHLKERREMSKIVSFVPQSAHINFDFLVEDLCAMGRYPYNDQHYSIVEWALRIVDAWDLRHRKVNSLSSGEKQRVYIARSLVTESPILLLDEPTASLDVRHQQHIWSLLKNLVTQGKIIIVTNHDLNATQNYCQHVVLFNNGKALFVNQDGMEKMDIMDIMDKMDVKK